jgi:hypothetical protein
MSQRRMSMRLNPNPIGARRAKGIRAEAIEPERRRANNIGTDVDEAGDSNSSESSESNRDQNAIILAKKKGQDKNTNSSKYRTQGPTKAESDRR